MVRRPSFKKPLPDTTIDRSKWAKSPIADWNSEASSNFETGHCKYASSATLPVQFKDSLSVNLKRRPAKIKIARRRQQNRRDGQILCLTASFIADLLCRR